MKYSIVIPTYNNCDLYLKPCLESIFKWTDMRDVELIVSANGCTDSTFWYLHSLRNQFDGLGFSSHFKVVWNDKPLGYAKATNEGIKACVGEKIVLLNNDTVLLEQPKNKWLELLDCGDVSGVLLQYSEIIKRPFVVFFCAMIAKEVFNKIGLINEDFNTGGCEDIEFCLKAEQAGFNLNNCGANGSFPIYHKGEGTVLNPDLVQDWENKFLLNQLKLAEKYNREWYYWRLSNNYERAVFLKGDQIFSRETQRYEWANKNLYGKDILEIGCSTGYGSQFLPDDIQYLGLDYDPIIVDVARKQNWGNERYFEQADINQYPLHFQDTIIAFEVIEHLDNGLEIVEMLKKYCQRLLISVPWKEPKGFWGEHHKLHDLDESFFPDFKINYVSEAGDITESPEPISERNRCNLMLLRWDCE